VVVVFLLVAPATLVYADVVDFTAQGNFTTAGPFSLGGVTITGSSTLSFHSGFPDGFGILGGSTVPPGFQVIGGGEFARFDFNAGSATGVSFFSGVAENIGGGSPNVGIQGFGIGGGSLGIQLVNVFGPFPGPYDVSSLFGNVPLSAFRITGGSPDAGLNLASLTFTPAGVPEPTSLLAWGLVSAAGFVATRLRRRVA
jgi:hypothetical protein